MRNLNIIVEGIDNVGKSTLIKNLKNNYNDYVMHNLHYSNVSHSTQDKALEYSNRLYNEMFNLMMHNIKNEKSGFICDRSHIGEMLYAPLYRGYSGDYVLDIEKSYHHILPFWDNLILITLVDDAENVLSRDDGLSFTTDLNEKKKEIQLFNDAHAKSTIKHKIFANVRFYNESELTNYVCAYIDRIINNEQ